MKEGLAEQQDDERIEEAKNDGAENCEDDRGFDISEYVFHGISVVESYAAAPAAPLLFTCMSRG
jgi:hypothetical protein